MVSPFNSDKRIRTIIYCILLDKGKMFQPIQFVSENGVTQKKDLCTKFLIIDAVILLSILVIKSYESLFFADYSHIRKIWKYKDTVCQIWTLCASRLKCTIALTNKTRLPVYQTPFTLPLQTH